MPFYFSFDEIHTKMKRHFVFGLLVMFMFVLSGCPMQTDVSIDNGSMELPAWLKGDWHSSNSGTSRYYIEPTMTKGNVKVYDSDEGHGHSNPRKCILSNIDGVLFLSVYYPGDESTDKGYFLYRLNKLSDIEFELREVKENIIPQNAPSATIKAFLMANKDSETIYGTSEKYAKDL